MSSHLQLSAEQFRHIRHNLKWDNRKSDKRTSPRVGVRNSVPMTLMAPNGQLSRRREVRVRNISRNGIGILYEERLPMGSRFCIQLPIAGEKELVAVYEVKHCETLDQKLYGLGGRLLAMGDPEEKPATPPQMTAAPAKDAAHGKDGAPAKDSAAARAAGLATNSPARQKPGLAATG